MKKFALKHDGMYFFDLRDGIIPPMNMIVFKAEDESHAISKLRDISFCESIGLGDWLFEPFGRLVQLN